MEESGRQASDREIKQLIRALDSGYESARREAANRLVEIGEPAAEQSGVHAGNRDSRTTW